MKYKYFVVYSLNTIAQGYWSHRISNTIMGLDGEIKTSKDIFNLECAVARLHMGMEVSLISWKIIEE